MNFGRGGLLGAAGLFGGGGDSGVGGLFDWLSGYKDPAAAGKPYLENIPGQVSPYFDPFIQRGERAGSTLEGQYGNMINDPSGMINKFGQGYQQSPGLDFAIKRAMEAGNRSAAAGGMAGSPAHQEQNMATATGMAEKDYYDWLDRTLGMYGRGISGQEGMYGKGFAGAQSMADMIAQMLAGEAGMEYSGTAGHNKMMQDILSSIIKAGAQAAGAAMGGG